MGCGAARVRRRHVERHRFRDQRTVRCYCRLASSRFLPSKTDEACNHRLSSLLNLVQFFVLTVVLSLLAIIDYLDIQILFIQRSEFDDRILI